MARGLRGLQTEYGEATVSLASGAGTQSVTFDPAYVRPPHVTVVPDEADQDAGATYSATNITKTGFTVSVASSSLADGDLDVIWFAHEKP